MDGGFSIDVFYWLTSPQPGLKGSFTTTTTTGTGTTAKTTTTTIPSNLVFPNKSQRLPGIVLSVPAGRYNAVRASYFQTRGGGDTVASDDVVLFSTAYSKGDALTAHYTLQNVKVSYDYLSYRVPPGATGFRFKTLWEIQYTTLKSSIDAPSKPVLADSSGAPISNMGAGTRWFIYPTLGAGVEHSVAKNFRWEARASGFAFPHHADIWDAEAWATYRMGRVEARCGVKGFHFKTSPKNEQYVVGTLSGLYVNLRWYPRWW